MASNMQGKRIAILATDGFEQVELMEPKKALEQAGAKTEVISPHSGEIQGWKHTEQGDKTKVDRTLDQANPEEFDALMLPGGVMNPDQLRMEPKAVEFVRAFCQSGKPVAAICHGPWMLVEAGVVKGKTIASWPSLQTDIRNAGGTWVDKEVSTDGQFITSRNPGDIPAFSRAMIERIGSESGRKAA